MLDLPISFLVTNYQIVILEPLVSVSNEFRSSERLYVLCETIKMLILFRILMNNFEQIMNILFRYYFSQIF